MPRDLGDRSFDATAFGDGVDGAANIGDGLVAYRIVRRPHVERELAAPRNDIDQTVRHFELPDRADKPLGRSAAALNRKHDLGCRRGGVVAQRHRHRAGMAGDTLDRDAASHHTGDRCDHAERKIALEQ